MASERMILALDQGTTSSRAILFDHSGRARATAQEEIPQIMPAPAVVEHDPELIWRSQLQVARQALRESGAAADQIAAIGITNQRETTILWDKATGRPIGNAMVWQSRASAGVCERLRNEGHEATFREKTGLLIDPYFSGSKVRFMLDADPALQARAEKGEILFGTVDTWLLWRLCGGRRHATDVSNASRTLMFNIHTLQWDDELLSILHVPRAMLPEICASSEIYAETDESLFGRAIPIAGDAGDQQAATFGQTCFEPGSVKNTYGTGCFMLLNTGERPLASENKLLTTVGWKVGGRVTYCLEGAVFIGGAVVQWLRDGLGIIQNSSDVEALAASVDDTGDVRFVPAFVGLGAPHWDPYARGTILGISRDTTAGHIARAAVESIAYQSSDLLAAMRRDAPLEIKQMKVDGGASVNDSLMQFQADLLGVDIIRPVVSETTALGAAYLAGLAVGYWEDLDEIRQNWQEDKTFSPQIPAKRREALQQRWSEAVRRSLAWASDRPATE